MDINQLLRGFECECGRCHRCAVSYVYVEKDVCRRLKEITDEADRFLIVADENTWDVCGERTECEIASRISGTVVFPGTPLLIPDEHAVQTVYDALTDDVTMIIGIGSGVIQDICKFCAFGRKLRYCIIATAPSMDGYASSGAAMIMGGMKVTYAAGVPYAVLADTDVLRKAPLAMLQAGYGDIIGKFSSLCDWSLSQVVNGEYLCPHIYRLTMETAKRVSGLGSAILARDPQAVEELMQALLLIGICMSFAGNSRPASGSEHHISHFYEITGILRGEPYFPHGIDVAFASLETARIREKILQEPFPEKPFRLPEGEYKALLERVYGPLAGPCADLQKENYVCSRPYREKEDAIRAVLAAAPSPAATLEMLAKAGLEESAYKDMYSERKRKEALFYAKELKERFSVLWMYYDFFGEESREMIY